MPAVRLSADAVRILEDHRWPGNIRQLKNITEQLSVIESERDINETLLLKYLPNYQASKVPALYRMEGASDLSEREILYKVLFEMKGEVNDLKKLVKEILKNGSDSIDPSDFQKLYTPTGNAMVSKSAPVSTEYEYEIHPAVRVTHPSDIEDSELVEESLSIQEKEKELIQKAIEKYKGRRKNAANELGISERTLYRKIKEYDLN
jgi:transcriptional regulator with PAS, ATPase and Fis domain